MAAHHAARHVDWVLLGAADEGKPAADGTVEAWGRSPDNPVGGWCGLRKGYRGPVRHVPPATAGSARPGRGHSRPAQQQDESLAMTRAVVARESAG